MATKSRIEWTEKTWNPVTGCTKISAGCKNCYAERLSSRLQKMGVARYANGFAVKMHPDVLPEPLRWKKPAVVFVNSMSDLFHDDVPAGFIAEVFDVMEKAAQHTFQVLTKRPERMLDLNLSWPPNVWAGVSVENQQAADERISLLLQTPAAVRFLSCEPLLGPVDLLGVRFDSHTRMDVLSGRGVTTRSGVIAQSIPNAFCERIDWVIVGGESGPEARPMHPDWARSIRNQCELAGVPFFFKQWGGAVKSKTGRILDGKTHDEMPDMMLWIRTEEERESDQTRD